MLLHDAPGEDAEIWLELLAASHAMRGRHDLGGFLALRMELAAEPST